MIRKLLKLAAYSKAPKSTFALMHPRRALKWGALYFIGKKILNATRKRPAHR